MIKSPVHEADLQEAGNSSLDQDHQGNKLTSTSSTKPNNLSPSPTPWLKLKDPRIVRVSRAFGGKDRHSKVCTIRGLRDRRVRLSVPTAIQLYDLQERLGLNQPSKVIDWLLDAAKHEIDELPPLPMPPSGAGFGVHHPSLVLNSSHDEQNDAHARMSRKNEEGEAGSSAIPRPDFWSTNPEGIWREKLKETAKETANGEEEEGHQKDDIGKSIGSDQKQLSNNFLTRISTNQHSFFPGLANNPNIPYGYQNWEQPGQSSNFQLPHHLAGSHGFGPQATELHNFNVLPSTLSLLTTQSYFPSHNAGATREIDPRQFNHIQMLSSSNSISPTLYPNSQTLRGVPHLSMMTNNLANSSNNPGNGHHHHHQQQEQPNEDQESPSR